MQFINIILKLKKKYKFLTCIYNILNSKPQYKKIYHLIITGKYTEVFPSAVTIETSTICNLKCPLCLTGNNKSKLEKGTLRFDDAKKVIDEISKDIKVLFLSNYGEPFLCKDIFDIIRYAKDKKMIVQFDSNLNYFNKEMAKKLVYSGLDYLRVSLDGASQEIYQRYRRGGDYQKVLKHVGMINEFKRKLKTSKPNLIWQFIPFFWNMHEIDKAKELAKRYKMDFKIRLNYDQSVTPAEYSMKNYDMKNKFVYEDLCGRLEQNPVVNWNGNMLGCCAVADESNHLGNVFKEGFFKMYYGYKMRLARNFIKKKLDYIPEIICKNCHCYNPNDFIRRST